MRLPLSAVLLSVFATTATAGSVSFASGWQEQRLSLFSSNEYTFGQNLGLVSDGSEGRDQSAMVSACAD